jgi:two-component system, NarL family, nitrate/nitrite response regulator NarL
MTARIRLMVVDDHTLFRRGLIALLDADGRFEVVGEAGDAVQAQRVAAACAPQVILLDHNLPGASGVASLPALVEAGGGAKVLMLTMSEDEHDLAAAMRAGAAGYLLKTADGEELAAAIVRAVAGQTSISPAMTARLAQAFRSGAGGEAAPGQPDALAELSPREREILELIARGQSNKEIARALVIAETTVKVHVQHILRKLNLSSRVQAAVVMASKRA